MSLSPVGQMPGYVAASDLSDKQFRLVKISAAGEVDLCGAGEVAAGVLINDPDEGEAADVMRLGTCPVHADGNSDNIAINDPLKSAADGIAVLADTDKDHVIGWSNVALSVDGKNIEAFITPSTANI